MATTVSTPSLQVSAAATATRKERRSYRKQQRVDFELVRESKVIWEHLRVNKRAAGKTLAQEEIMALAKGHFKEVCMLSAIFLSLTLSAKSDEALN